jgi:nicotinamide/nicotinate riboside kinase
MARWLVIGVSGVTCGGKSTLTSKLSSLYPKSHIICMDQFFLSSDDSRHIIVPGLNHNNWERLGAIDIEKWQNTIKYVLDSSPESMSHGKTVIPNFENSPENEFSPTLPVPIINKGLLILDGFLALNDPWTASQCHLKFYVTLTKEQCWERRQNRHYDPPDIPGYFEACVWPEHVKMKQDVQVISPDVVLLDGSKPRSQILDLMLKHIDMFLANHNS